MIDLPWRTDSEAASRNATQVPAIQGDRRPLTFDATAPPTAVATPISGTASRRRSQNAIQSGGLFSPTPQPKPKMSAVIRSAQTASATSNHTTLYRPSSSAAISRNVQT